MNYGAPLADMLLDAPRAAAANAFETLRRLAGAGDLEAVQSLAFALACELGHARSPEAFFAPASFAAMLTAEGVPPLLRLYAVGLSRRDLLAHLEAAAKVASAAEDADDFGAFQRLVRRSGLMQDEALRAFALVAFTGLAQTSRHTLSALGVQVMLDAIFRTCRIVPGSNADSDLRFGRDRIAALGGMPDFLFTAHHELAHIMFDTRTPHERGISPEVLGAAPALPDEGVLVDVGRALPALVDAARSLAEAPIGPADPRGAQLPSGLALIFRFVQDTGPFTLIELSQHGGPIGLRESAAVACLTLDVLSIERAEAAAAYTDRGVFVFGFAGHRPDGAAVHARLAAFEPHHMRESLQSDADAWLEALRAANRLGRSSAAVGIALGASPPAPPLRGHETQRAWADFDACRGVRAGKNVHPRSDELETLVACAARAADVAVLRVLLPQQQPDARKKTCTAALAATASSLFVMANGSERTYVGALGESTYAAMRVLAEFGGDPNAPVDDRGNTLLLDAAARSLRLTRALLAIGADANRANAAGDRALHAAASCDDEDIVRAVLDGGAEPDAQNQAGETALAATRSARVADVLCKAGSDADTTTPDGTTPLMRAASDGDVDRVRVLLAHGADPDASTGRGETAAHHAVWHAGPAARVVLEALFTAGVAVDEETNDGVTPLMLAARSANAGVLRYLIDRGANVAARTVEGNTALMIAAGARDRWPQIYTLHDRMEEAVRILAAAGADVGAQNRRGETALHAAAAADALPVVAALLSLGADPNATDTRGNTPLHHAAAGARLQARRSE